MTKQNSDLGDSSDKTRELDGSALLKDTLNAREVYVKLYSNCKMTYDSDKLIALSGLARLFHSRLGEHETYLAGLFKGSLVSQLAWEVDFLGERPGTRPRECWAPSWSWASIGGPITMGDKAVVGMVKVLHVDVSPEADPFGPGN